MQAGHFDGKRCGTCMGIEQGALRFGTQQRMVGVLAVDVGEPLAGRTQLRQRHRAAIDPRPAAPAGIDRAAQDQPPLVGVQRLLLQPARKSVGIGQVELRGHLGALTPGAHHGRVAAATERQPQRIEQNRLAGAGLAGQRTEAGAEFELESVDDDEVTDGQAAQHGEGGTEREVIELRAA